MAKQVPVSQEELDKFELFLFEMDDVLEPFVEAADSAGYKLDYSLDSLAELERYYADQHGQEDEGLLLNRGARYLGEVFRLTVGGQWRLSVTPRGLYFKLPVITDYSDNSLEYCPIAVFEGFAARRNSGSLRRSLEVNLPYTRKFNP